MDALTGLVLAAGRSTRMGSLNKLLARIGGHPMVWYAVRNLRDAGVARILVVLGHDRVKVKAAITDNVEFIVQEDQLGTAHAASQAIPLLGDSETVVVIFGDCPFLDSDIINRTLAIHRSAGAPLTIATTTLRDPRALGKVRRATADGPIQAVSDGRLEQRQASEIAEVFAGLSIWDAKTFKRVLPKLPHRSLRTGAKEQNLPDAVELLVGEGASVAANTEVSEYDALAPNNQVEFEQALAYLRTKVRGRLLSRNVEMVAQESVIVDYDVEVGRDTRIGRNVYLFGQTKIGDRCELGPDATLRDCVVADACIIGRGSWTNQAFQAGARASDKLAADHRYFKRPHFVIPEDPRSCFVILPFSEPYTGLLRNVIAPIIVKCSLTCNTADQTQPGAITDDIWEGINRAAFVIAEISDPNPNVWYELGLAHALNKHVIGLRRQDAGQIPFDVANQRILFYDPLRGDLAGLLEAWLTKPQY